MKNIKKIIATAMISVFAVTVVGCNLVKKTPEAIKKTVVAKVGDEKITQGDLDSYLAPMIDQFKQQYGENYTTNDQAMQQLNDTKAKLVDMLVEDKVLAKKGTFDKAEVEKDVDTQFNQVKDQYKDKFADALKQSGLTEDQFKETIRGRVIKGKVQEVLYKDVKVTDSDVKDYYDKNKDTQFVTKAGADMSHILLKDEASAKKAKERLDKGEDFKKVSDEMSTDEAAKAQGGSLGFIEYDSANFDKDFLAAAKNLKEGEVSGPIKTQFGYHIIKVKNVKATASVKAFDEVKDSIKAYLEEKARTDKYNTTYEQWKKDLKVEVLDKNLKTK